MNLPITYDEIIKCNTDMIPEEFKHRISDVAAEFILVMTELLDELSNESTTEEEFMEMYIAGASYWGKVMDGHINNIRNEN